MALKDWKIVRKDSDEIIYKSKDSGATLNIFETDMSVSTHKWGVQSSNLSINKGFKTKAQAMNYAKSYMRSH